MTAFHWLLQSAAWVKTAVLVPALVLVQFLGFAAVTAGQDDPQQGGAFAHPEDPRPLVRAADLRTYYFTPSHVRSSELRKLAERLHGRNLWVIERGGYEARPIENLQAMGDTIIIYDTEEYATRLGQALHDMDRSMGEQAAEPTPPRSVTYSVVEWTPRHLTLDSAFSALRPFQRQAMITDSAGVTSQVPNLAMLNETGQLVMRDTTDQVQQMQQLLERLDQPEPQVLITCLVIRGTRDADSANPGVPSELSQHLSNLVPYDNFLLESTGVLRTGVLAKEISIDMDGRFRLLMRSEAYDGDTGTMTVRCEFLAKPNHLETRTTLTAGEYVVLGASGYEPLFVVLQVKPLG